MEFWPILPIRRVCSAYDMWETHVCKLWMEPLRSLSLSVAFPRAPLFRNAFIIKWLSVFYHLVHVWVSEWVSVLGHCAAMPNVLNDAQKTHTLFRLVDVNSLAREQSARTKTLKVKTCFANILFAAQSYRIRHKRFDASRLCDVCAMLVHIMK